MSLQPGINKIEDVFRNVVTGFGKGTVINVHKLGNEKLICRAVLPIEGEVSKGDSFKSGVALRVVKEQVSVHGFNFRKVCSNGAIAPIVTGSDRILRIIEGEEWRGTTAEDVLTDVFQRLRVRSGGHELESQLDEMRSMSQHRVPKNIQSAIQVLEHAANLDEETVTEIVDQFLEREHPSLYGMMNAITAVARETDDPETQWDLEELGGGLGARLLPVFTPDTSGAVMNSERKVTSWI